MLSEYTDGPSAFAGSRGIALFLLPASVVMVKSGLGQNQPGPSPSPTSQWSEVSENRTCPDTSNCPAGRGFTVEQTGAFRSGQGSQGNLTQAELSTLNSSANAVAVQDLTANLKCDSSGAEIGVNVVLKKADKSVVVYGGKPDRTLCYRGEAGSAIALKNELDTLAQKYDVPAAPAPVTAPEAPAIPTPPGDECIGQPDYSLCGAGCAEEKTCGPPGCAKGFHCERGVCQPFTASYSCILNPCSDLPDGAACAPSGGPRNGQCSGGECVSGD